MSCCLTEILSVEGIWATERGDRVVVRLNYPSLPLEVPADPANDMLAYYDASAMLHKRVAIADLVAGVAGEANVAALGDSATGESALLGKTGVSLRFKGFTGVDGVQVATDGEDIQHSLDFSGLPLATVHPANDMLAFYDADANAHARASLNSLLSQVTLAALADVDTTPPTEGQVLAWNNGAGEWQPSDVATSLESLTDTDVAGAAAGALLAYDGAAWEDLPAGADADVLQMAGGVPVWSALASADVGYDDTLTSLGEDNVQDAIDTIWTNFAAFLAGYKVREADLYAANHVVAAGEDFIYMSAAAGALTLTLPAPASSTGRIIGVKKVDTSSNAITVSAAGGALIDGLTSLDILSPADSLVFHCDGIFWWVVMSHTASRDFFFDVASGRVANHAFFEMRARREGITSVMGPAHLHPFGDQAYMTAVGAVQVLSDSAADTSAGIGARTVTVRGVGAAWTAVEETVVLNGTTPVATSAIFFRVNEVVVATVGSSAQNVGTITVRSAATADIQAQILPKEGRARSANYTVPTAKTAHLVRAEYDVVSPAGDRALVTLRGEYRIGTTGTWTELFSRTVAADSAGALEFPSRPALPATSDFRVSASTDIDGVDAQVRVSLLVKS